ncbi:MAG: HDIG domain-containing protein [Candidatus Omnitrophica bacterium]|nr:HDIG domain-containing protein [Candidatus Omnitrophota bacterium]MCB9747731.1 HDIG domain-containing protein [Candidatus Omnitrophota bacterium]
MNVKNSQLSNTQKTILNFGSIVLFIIIMTLFCKSMGYSLIIPLFIFFLGVHLHFLGKKTKNFLHIGLLLAIIIFIAHIIDQYTTLPLNYIPVAAISILTMLLFNNLNLMFLVAFSSSVLVSLVLGGTFGMMLTFFLGSLIGAYAVREARTRGQLFSAGLFSSLIQVTCLLLLNPQTSLMMSWDFAIKQLVPLAANGLISALVVSATLKPFESLFGVLTNYSLLELSDFNQPLLKRMILEAPGTYHHSLVVSNLSEAAADAIGANALLTRVGAYYHDVGKMVKPEYFTENQMMGGNKHDNIEPSVSRLVILNHVKEGVEIAKKYKLNPKIIEFIPQHHGTSLMYYFYQKALEDAEDGETVKEEDFRYPGPKPQKRETAITLLADSVEGATRALDDPSPNRIEETVKKIINNKFIDGQLDECDLTLADIEKISATFIRILSAMYHNRIKYPEKKNTTTKIAKNQNSADSTKANKEKEMPRDGNRNSKSAEKDKDQSAENSSDNQKDSST